MLPSGANADDDRTATPRQWGCRRAVLVLVLEADHLR